jgi:hypothetical protein
MRKLTLDPEALSVMSFTTDGAEPVRGTVRGHLPTDFNECGISNPCTTDGQATIDAYLCTTAYGYDTIAATTCGRTNICCGVTLNRTYVCCQQQTTSTC